MLYSARSFVSLMKRLTHTHKKIHSSWVNAVCVHDKDASEPCGCLGCSRVRSTRTMPCCVKTRLQLELYMTHSSENNSHAYTGKLYQPLAKLNSHAFSKREVTMT